jgi:hypothetical protein
VIANPIASRVVYKKGSKNLCHLHQTTHSSITQLVKHLLLLKPTSLNYIFITHLHTKMQFTSKVIFVVSLVAAVFAAPIAEPYTP